MIEEKKVSMLFPIGETTPKPVTTTLLFVDEDVIIFFVLESIYLKDSPYLESF